MGIKVTLGNAAKVTRRTPLVTDKETTEPSLKIDRRTYQYLGSLVKNKTLLENYLNGTLPREYIKLLDELNVLYENNKGLSDPQPVAEGVEELDAYLGSLGVTDTYPYEKDIQNISAWMQIEDRAPYRVLTDTTDNTYLVDGTSEVLVYIIT